MLVTVHHFPKIFGEFSLRPYDGAAPIRLTLLMTSAISGSFGFSGVGGGFAISSLKRFSTSWLRHLRSAFFRAGSTGLSSTSLSITRTVCVAFSFPSIAQTGNGIKHYFGLLAFLTSLIGGVSQRFSLAFLCRHRDTISLRALFTLFALRSLS